MSQKEGKALEISVEEVNKQPEDEEIDKIELKYELILQFEDYYNMITCYQHIEKIIELH